MRTAAGQLQIIARQKEASLAVAIRTTISILDRALV